MLMNGISCLIPPLTLPRYLPSVIRLSAAGSQWTKLHVFVSDTPFSCKQRTLRLKWCYALMAIVLSECTDQFVGWIYFAAVHLHHERRHMKPCILHKEKKYSEHLPFALD